MIELKGKIWFDPKNVTKKHNNQAEWKRMAMVMFEGDASEYYAWFIKKRYNLILNRPLRGAHVSFINDSIRDMGDKVDKWDEVKEKYDGKEVKLILDTDIRGNYTHWWLRVPHEFNKILLDIRLELGLSEPYYPLHMTIGYPNPKQIEHNEYIINGIMSGLIS